MSNAPMTIIGLHWLDFSIILIYLLGMLAMGRWAQKRNKTRSDFYLAGRSLGKFTQFFLNFGASTNADQAVALTREIYRQGIGGMWIQYLVLFLTPFYWFTTAFMRRSRLVTLGDFFTERFKSKFLGAAFAVFTLVMAFIGGGVSYMVAGKTTQALTPKPEAQYTAAEKASVAQFAEFQDLRRQVNQGLTGEQRIRYQELNDRNKKGELKSFISYTNPLLIYLIFAFVVSAYTVMGGFIAAAMTDIVQGFLIVVFSLMLIPIGLVRVGGFAGLHAKVPDFMFNLFGSVTTSEYAWYTILAMILANLVSIIASAPMMQTAGSAKTENAARFGMIMGMYFKRFLMIFWALAGLLAVALFGGRLHDPDLIWGLMTRELLFPSAIGLMMVGILAANMSTLSANAVSYSALFLHNIYQPVARRKTEGHYMTVGKIVLALTLVGGVGTALFIDNILYLFQYFISMPAIFGAPIWLGFIWRRLTRTAVIIQVFLCFAIYALIPNVFQSMNWAKTQPRLPGRDQAPDGDHQHRGFGRGRGRGPGRAGRPGHPQAPRHRADRRLFREGRPARSGRSGLAEGRPRPLQRRDLGSELDRDRLHRLDQGPAVRGPVRVRRPVPVPPPHPDQPGHKARPEATTWTASTASSTPPSRRRRKRTPWPWRRRPTSPSGSPGSRSGRSPSGRSSSPPGWTSSGSGAAGSWSASSSCCSGS